MTSYSFLDRLTAWAIMYGILLIASNADKIWV